MKNYRCKTPVALIVYRRPETSFKVFERIRQVRPPKFFLISDAPREGVIDEVKKVMQCRAIKDMVDWDCEIYTKFSEVHTNCRTQLYNGISWVFDNVEEAIILEDDCLPDLSFFRFCDELLEKYRNDTRVTVISGSNHDWLEECEESYNFAIDLKLWGWASWRRAWKLFDIDMQLWPECRKKGWLKKLYPLSQYVFMSNQIQNSYEKRSDTWDFPFALANLLNHGLDIIPKVNMVRNIGFGAGATHSLDNFNKQSFYMDEEMPFPLTHPKVMIPSDRFIDIFPRLSKEEVEEDFHTRDNRFQELLQQNKFREAISYFKDTLRNSRVFHQNYVYYLSYSYARLGDYEHSLSLLDDLLKTNLNSGLFLIFVEILFNAGMTKEGFQVAEKILSRMQNFDDSWKLNLRRLLDLKITEVSIKNYPKIYEFYFS